MKKRKSGVFSRTASAVLCAGVILTALSACSSYDNDAGAWYDSSPAQEQDYVYDSPEQLITPSDGFISTQEYPQSSFSADVDTASYSILRSRINGGADASSIPENIVRAEEMLNYFDYGYDGPENGELFGVNAQISDCPWNAESKLLTLGLQTEKPDPAELPGSNLVFLIDVSGSMSSLNKLPLIKDALKYLVGNLRENDVISIVTYSGREEVLIDGATAAQAKFINRVIDGLHAGGSTNGEAGLEWAYAMAKKNFIHGGNNRIILASDGDLNVGIKTEAELTQYVSERRELGIYLSVLGFGNGNYRDAKMEALADNGNGCYYYIDGDSEIKRVFGRELVSTMHTVADDVKLQLEFNPEYVEQYRLIGYENRAMSSEEFDDEKKDAGEVGAGHSVTVMYEIKTTPSAEAAEDWMTLRIRYKNFAGQQTGSMEYTLGSGHFTESPSDNWRFAGAVAECALALKNDSYSCANIFNAERILESIALDDDEKQEFLELVRELSSRSF